MVFEQRPGIIKYVPNTDSEIQSDAFWFRSLA